MDMVFSMMFSFALARYGAFGAIFYTAFGGENHTTALAPYGA